MAIISLLLYSGIRLIELLALNLTDLDVDHNMITVLRKSPAGCYSKVNIHFEDEAKKFLREYLEVRQSRYNLLPTEEALFVSNHNTKIRKDRRLIKDTVEKIVTKYATYYGRPELTPKRLRQSFGTVQFPESDLIELSNQLGIEVNSTEVFRLLSVDQYN